MKRRNLIMSTYINEMIEKADKEAKDLEATSRMLVSTGLKSYWVFERYAGVAGTSAIRYNVDDRLGTFLLNILMKSDYDLDLWLAENMTEGHSRTPSADYNIKLLVPESPAYNMTFTITNNRYFAIKELLSKEDSSNYSKIINAQLFSKEKWKHCKANTDPREGVQYTRVKTEQPDITTHHEKNEHGAETTVVGTTNDIKDYLEYLIELEYSGLISLSFPEIINEPCNNTDSDNATIHCTCTHSGADKNMRCIIPGALDDKPFTKAIIKSHVDEYNALKSQYLSSRGCKCTKKKGEK